MVSNYISYFRHSDSAPPSSRKDGQEPGKVTVLHCMRCRARFLIHWQTALTHNAKTGKLGTTLRVQSVFEHNRHICRRSAPNRGYIGWADCVDTDGQAGAKNVHLAHVADENAPVACAHAVFAPVMQLGFAMQNIVAIVIGNVATMLHLVSLFANMAHYTDWALLAHLHRPV
ncbi:hypothetical protein A0H81_07976 [Grifola frondosa]|uniref:Uncharacterized protein n=1 Tax=Grifola frondosa TaxID=5627 RepID=A0A1C7M6G6_GRIFR|nr:hypothetical protein A0H81_07976 [Grifola frondosa]